MAPDRPVVPRYRYSLLALAGALIGCIALIAAVNLWYLSRLHGESLHTLAAQSVVNQGAEFARVLAAQPAVRDPNEDEKRWAEFRRVIQSLRHVEPSLQYVSVSEGDVIVFHDEVGGGRTNEAQSVLGAMPPAADIRVGRARVSAGNGIVPVLTFTAPDTGSGPRRWVQIALRKEAVNQREAQATAALGLMLRLAVATLAISFGLAVLLVAGLLRQEIERHRRERASEHLAFAGALADGIIHDVRNPLSSLRLDVQMLQKEAAKGSDGSGTRITELAARARKTMDRVDLVMREFLYVSRPEPAERERVDVNECVRDCLDLLGPRFEAAGVRLQAELASAPLPVLGYGVGLKRAAINILTNAKQASPAQGKVTVRTWQAEGAAWISVEDEGPGIPKREMKRLFEMFASAKPEGTGLGLHLAKAAVENSGGTVSAENRTEGGAKFTIRLPMAGDAGPASARGA